MYVYDIAPANKKQSAKITGIESAPQSESTVYSIERSRVSINLPFKYEKKYADRISNFDPSADVLVIDTKSFGIPPSSMVALAKTKKNFKRQKKWTLNLFILKDVVFFSSMKMVHSRFWAWWHRCHP